MSTTTIPDLVGLWVPESSDTGLTYGLVMTDIDQYRTYREVGTQLNDREHTLVDVNFSRTAEPRVVLFFRPVRYDEFTTTSGVSFPFPGEEKEQLLDEHRHRIDPDASQTVSRQRFVAFHDLYHDHGIHIQYQ